jgi:eukaryotic-like serine/threonine-protein kinase
VTRTAPPLEGTRLGDYELVKVLGEGGMGSVFRATSTAKDRPRAVAIKVLAPELARDATAVERFEREATAAARLDHPNVVRIFEVGQADGHHFLVMELISGPPFRQLIAAGDAPARVVAILAQVADGLAHAHARGIVHRDIKPDNVLIDRADHARIADFGLARISDAASLSSAGQVFGTVKYMSPEQAQGKKVGAPSDVYSIGVMLYEAITGAPPFSAETQHGFVYKHVTEPPPRPALLPGFSPRLARLALDCLAKDPGARPTMREVAARLAGATGARSPRRRVAWIGAVALVGAIAVWLAAPHALDPLCDGWFGAPAARALRDWSLAIRGVLP